MKAPVVVIHLDGAYVDQTKIETLRDLLAKYPGPSEVRLRIEAPDTGIMELILDDTCGVAYTTALSDAVERLLGYPALQTCEREPEQSASRLIKTIRHLVQRVRSILYR